MLSVTKTFDVVSVHSLLTYIDVSILYNLNSRIHAKCTGTNKSK